MASKSLTIWNKLIEIIALMTKEDGYHNDMMTVSKKMFDIDAESSFPLASILQGAESKEIINEDETLYRATRTFYIIGYGEAESDSLDEGLVGEKADELAEDLQEILLNNFAMFDEVDFDGLTIVSVDPMPIEGMNKFFVGVEIRVKYTHDNNI